MTKFANMRVRVPIDDELTVQQVIRHLQDVLEQRGTERLELLAEQKTNGHDQTELPETPAKSARVHWPAADVVQQIERPPPAPKPARGRGAAA